MDVESPKLPVQNKVLVSVTNTNQSRPGSPCVGSPCFVPPNFNGTNLLWDDMRRTLAFAWELHVFGSASLFILMAVVAVTGIVGARSLPHPICDALTLANSLLILGGILRAVLLLLDPYGTRNILSHATLAALHNLPLQLLLWAQVALALVTLTGLNLLLSPLKLQHLWVVGGLAILHCIPLLVADLLSTTLSPTIPMLLHTLSICWGLLLFMGIFSKSCSDLHLRSSVPQWVPSQRIERCAQQVTAACAFLGLLCCSLQMYSLLWLYGQLGNWRRFGWAWWLSQFWARILELSWGFSLLVLGSWIFRMPSRGHLRGDQGQSTSQVSKESEGKSLWIRILASIRKGPLRQSQQTWEDLMPSNWAKYNLSKSGFNNHIMSPYDDKPTTIAPEHKPDADCSSFESQAALMLKRIGDRECILSLLEYDQQSASPINLGRRMDNALYQGHLVAGTVFTPPPPSWTQSVGRGTTDGHGGTSKYPSAYIGYGWPLDTESISASLDHFQMTEPMQLAGTTADNNLTDGSQATAHQGIERKSASTAMIHLYDWLDDDVTDL